VVRNTLIEGLGKLILLFLKIRREAMIHKMLVNWLVKPKNVARFRFGSRIFGWKYTLISHFEYCLRKKKEKQDES
jgi:hypothetical protein